MIATVVPHMCGEYFRDPARFDIDRYLPDRNGHTVPGVFAPFGLDTRRCLDSRFTEIQRAIFAATLLYRLDVALNPPNFELKPNDSP